MTTLTLKVAIVTGDLSLPETVREIVEPELFPNAPGAEGTADA
jgi:hypothetical protein